MHKWLPWSCSPWSGSSISAVTSPSDTPSDPEEATPPGLRPIPRLLMVTAPPPDEGPCPGPMLKGCWLDMSMARRSRTPTSGCVLWREGWAGPNPPRTDPQDDSVHRPDAGVSAASRHTRRVPEVAVQPSIHSPRLTRAQLMLK